MGRFPIRNRMPADGGRRERGVPQIVCCSHPLSKGKGEYEGHDGGQDERHPTQRCSAVCSVIARLRHSVEIRNATHQVTVLRWQGWVAIPVRLQIGRAATAQGRSSA